MTQSDLARLQDELIRNDDIEQESPCCRLARKMGGHKCPICKKRLDLPEHTPIEELWSSAATAEYLADVAKRRYSGKGA